MGSEARIHRPSFAHKYILNAGYVESMSDHRCPEINQFWTQLPAAGCSLSPNECHQKGHAATEKNKGHTHTCRLQCPPPPLCPSYTNVHNYYGPYAHCSLDKGVACTQHIQLPTHTCVRAWYECTLTSTHISKSMQTQESLGNMKISGSHPYCHKQ